MINIERANRVIAKCRQCGKKLADGDTAYALADSYYCPECVSEALVICRPDDYYDYVTLQNRLFGKDD